MKLSTIKSTLLSLILLSGLSLVKAQTIPISLAWDKNPELDIMGYLVYQKVVTSSIPPVTEPTVTWKLVGQTTSSVVEFTVPEVAPGKVIFAVSAFNSAKVESAKSDELEIPIPAAPKGLKFKITLNVTIQP